LVQNGTTEGIEAKQKLEKLQELIDFSGYTSQVCYSIVADLPIYPFSTVREEGNLTLNDRKALVIWELG